MAFFHRLTFLPRFIRQLWYKPFNRLMFWSAGVSYGKGMNIYNRFYLKKYTGSFLYIGQNLLINSGECINPICRNIKGCFFVNKNAKLVIGDNVGMSSPCIWCDNYITIGNNVKLGGLVTILDTDCHSLNYVNRRFEDKDNQTTHSSPVIIEDDVLIGANSIILKGVQIGARSIIGAGSVVTKNVPPDCVAAGNPCKVIHKLINRYESFAD